MLALVVFPLTGCLQDLPNLRMPLFLKVALESLSFGNGTLQNEKKFFRQATKKNVEPQFFLMSDKFFFQATTFFF